MTNLTIIEKLSLMHNFSISPIRRIEERENNAIHNFFDFYLNKIKTGQAQVSIFHNDRELFWQSFEPLSTLRDARRKNLGTLAYGLALTGVILTEDVQPDYKIYHDSERPICVATLFDLMNLPSGLTIQETLDRYIPYAKSKGFVFTNPFLDKNK